MDSRAIARALAASPDMASAGVAVVCADGTPQRTIAALVRAFQEGGRAAVLYLHDAATVLYPFALEPVATLVKCAAARPLPYADLGLPPLGALPPRFGDERFRGEEPVFTLDAVPIQTLVRYIVRAAERLCE